MFSFNFKEYIEDSKEELNIVVQMLKQNKRNFTILGVWFYLGAVLDISISVLGFLTIGIEHEGNPNIVDAWYGDFSSYVIKYLIAKVIALFLFLFCLFSLEWFLVEYKYIDSKKGKFFSFFFRFGTIILVMSLGTLAILHWTMVFGWSIEIVTNAQIPGNLIVWIYLLFLVLNCLFFWVCLKRLTKYEYDSEVLKFFEGDSR